jgi:hypothetical protein
MKSEVKEASNIAKGSAITMTPLKPNGKFCHAFSSQRAVGNFFILAFVI